MIDVRSRRSIGLEVSGYFSARQYKALADTRLCDRYLALIGEADADLAQRQCSITQSVPVGRGRHSSAAHVSRAIDAAVDAGLNEIVAAFCLGEVKLAIGKLAI